MNLLENARVGVGEGGTVHIEADEEAGRVTVDVVDDGSGIPEDLLPRVLEPHFSTRSKGTGLGLAIVGRIVDSWGGEVDISSRAGDGTRVRIALNTWTVPETPGAGHDTP